MGDAEMGDKNKGFSIGRDKFLSLYADLGSRLEKRKRRRKTTDSTGWHNQYEDLRKDLIPSRPKQLMEAYMSNHMLTPFQMHQQSMLPIKTGSKKDKRTKSKNTKTDEVYTNYNTQI